MSTSVDTRRRPSLWSYISFSSTPRRRSVSLPTRSNHDPYDPYEKEDRHRGNDWGRASGGTVDNLRDAWMTQSQRSRYLKSGGVVAFFLFLLLLFSGRNTGRVGDIVKGMCFPYNG